MKSNDKIPSWPLRFLRLYCPEHLYEEIEGDLLQRHQRDVAKVGEKQAKRRLLWNAIRFFRPGIIFRSRRTPEFRYNYMIKNYFRLAIRNLVKNWVFSIINISGLAVGIVAFVLIMQYVNFETSFDSFYESDKEIYRIAYSQYENGEEKNNSAMNFIGIRQLIKDHFPEVKTYTGFSPIPANLGFSFGYNGKNYLEPGKMLRVDSGFFKTFPGLLTKGDPSRVLSDQHNLVISEKIAAKIFGDEDPIGKHIVDIDDHARDGNEYVISGMIRDIPANSHFHTDFICIMEQSWDTLSYHWDEPNFYTYVALERGTEVKKIESRLNDFLAALEKDHPDMKGSKVFFQPLRDIHFYSHLKDELETNGSAFLVFVLFAVGIVVLLIAWINFVNLEIARFGSMAREVGIRRIIGSAKSDLVFQIFIKYFCLTLASILLAGVLIVLVTPYFSFITGVPINEISWTRVEFWIPAILIFVTGSLIMGIYPILVLIKLNPVVSIKGKFSAIGGKSLLRGPLAVVQFTASIVLLAFLIVVTRQLEFMQLSNKKIDVDKVVVVPNPLAYNDDSMKKREDDFNTLKNKLLATHNVKAISTSSAIPGSEIGFTLVNEIKRKKGDLYNPERYKLLFVDYDFISLYDLKLKAGRNFVPGDIVDGFTAKLIFNETAIYNLGFKSPEEAIGQIVQFPFWNKENPGHEIIGVVEDYHHEAIKHPVPPVLFILNQEKFQQVYFSIRMAEGSDPRAALYLIEESWKDIFPDRPFSYFFLDDHYDQQFKSEVYFGRIFGAFSSIAIFLACLGILGITLFEANARLKEISIRKVLGGSMTHLVALLSKEHMKVVLISGIVSMPLIYLGATYWLTSYPVRIELNVIYFLMPLLAIFLVSMLVSATQTVRAANTNPVDHLKNE